LVLRLGSESNDLALGFGMNSKGVPYEIVGILVFKIQPDVVMSAL